MVAAPTEATDDQLVVAAQQGSDAAFDALFRRYRDRITAYVRSIVSDHARAEDIVQDVFMSALRSLRATEREVAFKPWVYEIAKNACIDHIRRVRRTSEVSIDSDDFSPVDEGRLSVAVASTDAAFSTREDLDVLKMAFNDLPDAQREVLVSRELEGLSYDTIASRTGLSRSAVESMLFRARRTLKDGFDDISTGERCQRMRTVMADLSDGRIGIRKERRLVSHLGDCGPCRREAIALGLDDLALGAPSRAKSALSRVAGFLPLPAFLRRRFFDGSGLAGSAAQGGAAEGLTLAGKAAVVLAVAAIAGGGAGVAHKAGAIGGSGGGGTAAGELGSSEAGGGAAGGSGVGGTSAGGGSGAGANGNSGGTAGGSADGSSAGGAGPAGQAAGDGGQLGNIGELVNGVGGKSGTGAGGTLGGAANGVGGTVNGVGGTVDKTVTGVGGTVDTTVTGVTGTVDKTVKGVTGATGTGGTLDKPVSGVTGTVDKTVKGTTGTLDRTVKDTTKTATGLSNTLTSPTTTSPTTTVPKLLP
jgi:RNA polymerase sigma factor (sigma-70 family)